MLKRFTCPDDVPLDVLQSFALERCTAASLCEIAARLEVQIHHLSEFIEDSYIEPEVRRRVAQWYVREAEKAETLKSRLIATTRAGVLTLICGTCEGPVGVDAFDRDADGLLMEYTCSNCGNGIVKLDPETWENALSVPLHDYSDIGDLLRELKSATGDEGTWA